MPAGERWRLVQHHMGFEGRAAAEARSTHPVHPGGKKCAARLCRITCQARGQAGSHPVHEAAATVTA
ncbi:hypothetical protein G6F55_014480 [Rhizopus delemar]|nr:hypothetical protein G6F55_014480 [Rhizopus delemar]